MIKRFTEEEFLNRVNYLWNQFHERPEMSGISFEDFKKECYEEFRKQQQMSDKSLKNYRDLQYKKIVLEANQLLTEEEKKKFNEQDKNTIMIPPKI